MSENRPPAAESLKSILADLRRENLPIRKAPPRDQWVKRTKRLERLMILASFEQHGDWTHQLPKMPAGICPEPDDWTHAIPKVLDGIAMITGSAHYRANEPTKRGPKRKRSHLLEFRRFGKDLWRIARHHGGDFK